MTPEEIDQIICAEIPDETVTIERKDKQNNTYESVKPNSLHTLVTDMMLHGPCGKLYPERACMKSGECKSGFPKKIYLTQNYQKIQNLCTGEDHQIKVGIRLPSLSKTTHMYLQMLMLFHTTNIFCTNIDVI